MRSPETSLSPTTTTTSTSSDSGSAIDDDDGVNVGDGQNSVVTGADLGTETTLNCKSIKKGMRDQARREAIQSERRPS